MRMIQNLDLLTLPSQMFMIKQNDLARNNQRNPQWMQPLRIYFSSKQKTIRFMKLLSSLYRYSYEKERPFPELIFITEMSRIIALHLIGQRHQEQVYGFRQVPLIYNKVRLCSIKFTRYELVRGSQSPTSFTNIVVGSASGAQNL